MVYDVEALRNAVRDILMNQGEISISNDRLDTFLVQGKRRLDEDRPRKVVVSIAGNGKKFHQLTTTVPEWVNDFSVIDYMIYPAPTVANDDEVVFTEALIYNTVMLGGGLEYLRCEEIFQSGKTALVTMTTRWKVEGLDGATETTIDDRHKNALEIICAVYVCGGLEVKSAGQLDDQIEGDLINWGGKQASFKFAAQDLMSKYWAELRVDPNKPRAIMRRADYGLNPDRLRAGGYMTHRMRDSRL